jgi:hypothetical protein
LGDTPTRILELAADHLHHLGELLDVVDLRREQARQRRDVRDRGAVQQLLELGDARDLRVREQRQQLLRRRDLRDVQQALRNRWPGRGRARLTLP